MENKMENTQKENVFKDWEADHKVGKIVTGIFIVIVGSIFLAKELGNEIPTWLWNWKMLLIGIGIVSILKHRFRKFWGLLPIIVGGALLTLDMYPALEIKTLIWPVMIILVGLFVIFKPKKNLVINRIGKNGSDTTIMVVTTKDV